MSMEDVFRENISYLSKNLPDLEDVSLQLYEKEVISKNERDQTLMPGKTPFGKANDLIFLLITKDTSKLPIIIHILRNTGYNHLADVITKTAEKKNLLQSRQQGPTSSQSSLWDSGNSAIGTSTNKRPLSPIWNQNRENKISKVEKLLIEKWWPEKKYEMRSYCERKINGQSITEKLHQILQQSKNKATVITQDKLVVSGLGGIGKTTIAKSFAITYQKEYDFIIWIDCGEGNLITSFKLLAMDLKINNRDELSLKRLAKDCLAKLNEHRCLIIYDNAECYVGNQGIRDVLPNPEVSNCHSIITSRNQEWGSDAGYGKIETFSLNVFNDEESLQFLIKSLHPRMFDEVKLVELAKLLGHLPLALQIAVATLTNGLLTIDEYNQSISKDDEAALLLHKERIVDDYELSINKAMKISLDQIEKEENGKIAHKVLIYFGFIQPDEVDIGFFQLVDNQKLAGIKDAISLLQKYSLVTSGERQYFYNTKTVISIHRLLQQVIRLNGKSNEKEILTKILSANWDISLKLVPYLHAEKFEDLKEQFRSVRAELIDQVGLTEIIEDKRFSEAVKLSLMVHKSFDELTSKNNFLISLFNHAVCLDFNNELENSIQQLQIVLKHLNEMDEVGEITDTKFTLNENCNRIQFHTKRLGSKLPNKYLVKYHLDLQNGIRDFVKDCLSSFIEESAFLYNLLEDTFDLPFSLLYLAIYAEGQKTEETCIRQSARENLSDVCKMCFDREKVKDVNAWFAFLSSLENYTCTHLSYYEQQTSMLEALVLMYQFARMWMYSPLLIIDENNPPMKHEFGFKLYELLKDVENDNNCRSIMVDMFLIRYELLGSLDHICSSIVNDTAYFEDWMKQKLTVTVNDGEGDCEGRNMWEITSIKIPTPSLLTSLKLCGISILTQDLITCLTPCVNLMKIYLGGSLLCGPYKNKIHLTKLRHLEAPMCALKRELWDMEQIDYFCFLSGENSDPWEFISKLGNYSLSIIDEYSVVDYKSNKLHLSFLKIIMPFPFNLFSNLDIYNCMIVIDDDEKESRCISCLQQNNEQNSVDSNVSVSKTNIHISSSADSVAEVFTPDYCDDSNSSSSKYQCPFPNTKQIKLQGTTFVSRERNEECLECKKSTSKQLLNSFLRRLPNLRYLYCDVERVVNLWDLVDIEEVEVESTRICCKAAIESVEMAKRGNQSVRTQKRLSLSEATPVGDDGESENTIDLSSLAISQLEWSHLGEEVIHTTSDRLPVGLQKLYLRNVSMDMESAERLQLSKLVDNSTDSYITSLRVLVLDYSFLNAARPLKLSFISSSLKTLKLVKVPLSGEVSDKSSLKLDKLILDDYEVEHLKRANLQSLMRHSDFVVITFTGAFESLLSGVFHINVQQFYARVVNVSPRYFHCERVIEGDGVKWKREIITYAQFDEQDEKFPV